MDHLFSNLVGVMTHPKLFDVLTSNPKVSIVEEKIVGVRSLVCSTSGVKGRVGAPRWGLGRLTSNSITHMDLHKLNNKLVNA